MADGHTGDLFVLSENDVVLTLSWGCLDMKLRSLEGVSASWAFYKCFSASCVSFRGIEQNANGELDIIFMSTTRGRLGAASRSLGT